MTSKRAAAFAVFALVMVFARVAAAHLVDLSQSHYAIDGARVRASLGFAGEDLTASYDAAPPLEIAQDLVKSIRMRGDGAPCVGVADSAQPATGDGLTIEAHFDCPASPKTLAIDFEFLERFSSTHRHMVTLEAQAPVLVMRTSPHFETTVGHVESRSHSFISMLWTGVLHILTGYDHLAFLVALVLVGGKPRALALVVTAFTVAHSISLALAVLHVWAPSPRLVEPLIALSIVYVAIENFFVKDAAGRWRITFPFGLVHGFGFAGALTALDLPRARIPAALLAFNLGVEMGQLAVLAVLAFPLYFARKSARFRSLGVHVLSAMLAIAGAIWFVMRVV